MLFGLVAVLAGCATTRPRPRATLVLTCNVPDASLWVDDGYVGIVATWAKGGPLPVGFHRIEIRHPGHFSFFAEVNPRQGETVRLAPVLLPLLD